MEQDAVAYVDEVTRGIEAGASMEQDLVRFGAPVMAGVRPAAMFSCPYTRTPREKIRVRVPQVLLECEFNRVLEDCRAQLEPQGVLVKALARREHSALLYVYRPQLAASALAQDGTAANMEALGYNPADFDGSLAELAERIRLFDELERPREFWDFPHEVGYFLGYPAPDVMAYVRHRGRGFTAAGTWHVYGCRKRAAAAARIFAAHAECTRAYWDLYLGGATLAQLAALGSLNLPQG